MGTSQTGGGIGKYNDLQYILSTNGRNHDVSYTKHNLPACQNQPKPQPETPRSVQVTIFHNNFGSICQSISVCKFHSI